MENLLRLVNELSPFHTHNHIKIDIAENGTARTTLKTETNHLNLHETVHGGFYYTLCDTLSGTAARSACGQDVVTVDARVSFLRNVGAGEVIHGEAWVEKAGKNLVFTSCKITNDEGKLLSTCQSTFAIIK